LNRHQQISTAVASGACEALGVTLAGGRLGDDISRYSAQCRGGLWHDRQGDLSLKGGDVATLEPTASLATAAMVLAERRIGALVVMDCAHRVAGIVSERDGRAWRWRAR
jgi:CBS domain